MSEDRRKEKNLTASVKMQTNKNIFGAAWKNKCKKIPALLFLYFSCERNNLLIKVTLF